MVNTGFYEIQQNAEYWRKEYIYHRCSKKEAINRTAEFISHINNCRKYICEKHSKEFIEKTFDDFVNDVRLRG